MNISHTYPKDGYESAIPIAYDTVSIIRYGYKSLFEQFDIKVLFQRFSCQTTTKNSIWIPDSCIVLLTLINKVDYSIFDAWAYTSIRFYSFFFTDTANVLSYSTGVNTDKEACDNYFGDIVIADFNFDNLDDIAVVNDMGGNSGCHYSFYIQKVNHKFVLDKFLTDSMMYFPSKIDFQKRTLTTYAHASVIRQAKKFVR